MTATDHTDRQNIQNLLAAPEEELLRKLGEELTPPLGARVPTPAELIKRAQLWFTQKQPYLKEKICGNVITQNALVGNDSPEVELAIAILQLLLPDLTANQALIVTVLIVRYGLKNLCADE